MSYDRSLVVPQAQESMSTTSATTSSFEPYSIPLDPYNDASDQSTSTIQQQQQRIVSVVTSAEVTNDSIFGLPVVRDWNAEYQGTLERMKSAASDQLACMVQLRDLAEDFVETAERYGRIIVSERHVSNELKTVKPAALGGVAGGEKFVVHGILFKFALDQRIPASSSSALPQWMYGGSAPNDENAMRAAGHELKGVIAMSKCHVDDLCLPLMCLIDYLGFRLVAMSSLPISRRSIVYGSCDGASIHADDDDVNAMIATVARKLNLAPHLVADRTLHVAGDIEAHRGADGRAYVIDLARLMPPEAPDDATNDPRAVFHRLLRAEHVRSADAPLSSDAFTNFQRYDRRAPELNAAVRRETVRLFEQVVPRVAAALCQHVRRGSSLPPNAPRHPRRALTTNSGLLAHDTASSGLSPPSSPSPHSAASPRGGSFIMSPMRDDDDERELLTASQRTSALSGEQLVEILHQHGVNLRHCGRVRRAVVALGESSNDAAETAAAALVQRVLLSEMCARVVKKRLESGWRRLATTALSIQPHRRLVLSEFNRVFGPSLEATSHWRDYAVASMKFELHRKFRDCLTTAELLTAYDLRHAVDVPLMFWRLQRMTGITMSARARRELATSLQFTFVEPDVEQLHATTKHSNLVVHVSGVVLAMQAAAMPSAGAEFDRLFAIAVEKFRKALHSVPDDVSTQFQFAKLVHVRAKLQSDMELFAEARERYDAALRVDAEFAPAQLALSLLELDRLAVRAIEWRARAVIMAAASEHQSNHDVLRQSRRVVAFPLASADVERLFDACSERARVAIAASSRTDGLRAEARNAAAAFIALERSLMPQTNDVYVRPLMRRAAADVALGSGAALLGALVAAPEPSRQQQLHTSATSSSSTDDSDAARVVQRDADARRLSFVCCRWALAYLCSADLSLSTALQLIEHAGRRLQTAANAEPTQLLAWLGPMAYDDAALIAFAHIAATSCSVLQEAVRERLQYVEEVYVDRCVALPASLLASSLVQCARLRVLSLRGCFQANDALLIALVRSLPTLRMLDLSQCVTLTPDAIVVVANSLPQLRGIVLDRCDLIDNTSVRQLALRCTSLQYLSLARTRGSPSLADHALEPVAALTDLRFLAIDHHYLLSERTVCTVLSACRRIRCLRADGCTKLTSRGLLNAIGRRASSFALAFDSFRDSIGVSPQRGSPPVGRDRANSFGASNKSRPSATDAAADATAAAAAAAASTSQSHALRFVSLVGNAKNVASRHVRQFNQMMVEVRLDGHSRVYSDDCISVDLQRTMMSFFVKSGLYVAQRPVLPTSGAAASATTSHAALRLPRDTPTSEDDGGGTSGAEDGGNDSQLLHSSSGSSTAPNIRLTVSSPRHERRQSAENAWLQSASDAEENAELGLSASLAALELDFERSFSQSLDLSSNGSIGVGGPAGTTTSTTAAATGSSASRTSDHKPAAGAPEKKFLLLEREDAELKRAMQESLATAHAAQLAMLSGNHHQLNSAANMLHFDDDDDDDLDYLSASANVFDAEEDDAESEDEDDDEENDDEDQ